MNRLIIASAVAIAAAAVSLPAVAGLSNNPSFSHRLPVHVPSSAKVVQLDDHGKVVNSRRGSDDAASTTVTTPSRSGAPEPSDDRGQSTEPGDDRGHSSEPGHDGSSGGNRGPGGGGSSSSDDSGHGGGSGSSGGDNGHGG